jgi:hypothetical protein
VNGRNKVDIYSHYVLHYVLTEVPIDFFLFYPLVIVTPDRRPERGEIARSESFQKHQWYMITQNCILQASHAHVTHASN